MNDKTRDREAESAERLIDGSFVSRAIYAACRKAGPYSLMGLLILFGVFWFRWPEEGAEPGIESSLVERYFRRKELERARSLLEQGDVPSAAAAWKDLLRKHPGDPRMYRMLLDEIGDENMALLAKFEDAEEMGAKLLEMGRTNRDDLFRVIRLNAGLGNWRRVKQLSGDVSTNFTPELGGVLARAYFESNDLAAFEQFWTTFQAEFSANAAIKPWRWAADAVQKREDEGGPGMRELTAMRGKPNERVLGLRLLSRVALLKGDAPRHAVLVQEMIASKLLRPSDWIEHVELLARLGRLDEARSYSERIDEVRGRGVELADVVLRLHALRFHESAAALLGRSLKVVPRDVPLSVMEGLTAFLASDWGRCNSLAFSLRGQQPTAGVVDPISYFLEGYAVEGTGYAQKAKAAFDEMELVPSSDPVVVLGFAEMVSRLSVAPSNNVAIFRAWRMAKSLETFLSSSGEYWRGRSILAGRANQVVDMVSSAKAAMEADHASPQSRSVMARALSLSGGDKAEVLRLTSSLMRELPVTSDWRIQHAVSLAASGNPDEARKVLEVTAAAGFPPRLQNEVRLAWLEVYVAKKDWGGARKVAGELKDLPMERLVSARLRELQDILAKQ